MMTTPSNDLNQNPTMVMASLTANEGSVGPPKLVYSSQHKKVMVCNESRSDTTSHSTTTGPTKNNNMFVASVSPSSSPASTTDTHPFPQTQYPLHGFTYSSVPLPGYNPPSSVMYNNPFGNYFPPFPHQGQHYYTSPNSSSGSNLMEKSNVLLSDGGSNSESECKVILPESHSDPKKNVLSAMPIKKRALSNVVKKPLEESKQNEEPPATSTNVEVKKKQPRTKDSPTKSDESEKKRKKVRDENEELKKKERRLVRNRQSAQASRERKKQYIQSLEAKVAELENKVRELEEENIELKKKQKP